MSFPNYDDQVMQPLTLPAIPMVPWPPMITVKAPRPITYNSQRIEELTNRIKKLEELVESLTKELQSLKSVVTPHYVPYEDL